MIASLITYFTQLVVLAHAQPWTLAAAVLKFVYGLSLLAD